MAAFHGFHAVKHDLAGFGIMTCKGKRLQHDVTDKT